MPTTERILGLWRLGNIAVALTLQESAKMCTALDEALCFDSTEITQREKEIVRTPLVLTIEGANIGESATDVDAFLDQAFPT